VQDLNDFYYFHAVVTHHGFSAAARRMGVPKATLSKRVARLEESLDVRLLERSTRSLRTTEVGRMFYDQVQAMLLGAEAAEAVAVQAHAEPQGIVRVSCPQGLVQDLMAEIIPTFMEKYPKVRLQMKILNRRADLIEDGVDLALRARTRLDTDNSLIVRQLGVTRFVVAISPKLAASYMAPFTLDSLTELPSLSIREDVEDDTWDLVGANGETRTIVLKPHLFCSNFDLLCSAAIKGVGISMLPEHIARPHFASGKLLHVLPGWHTPYGIIHAVFSSRKGLVPAVRALIDHLAQEVPKYVLESSN
jgi:DNA-binding transcriptional LysR family regulator